MKKVHYAWVMVIVCCAIACCSGIIMTGGSNFYRIVAEELGVGVGVLTIYVTILSLTMAFLLPIAEKMLSKSLKGSLIIGGVCQYTAFALMGSFTKVYHFYIAGLFMGIGASITMFMAIPLIINMWFEEKKGTAMGISLSFMGVSGAIISPLAGWYISVYGWREAYLFLSAIGIVIYLSAVVFLLKTPEEKGMHPYRCGASEVEEKNDSQIGCDEGKTFAYAKKSKEFYFLIVFVALFAGLSSIATQVSAISTGHFGFTITTAATMVSLYAVGNIIGKLGIGVLADKVGYKKSLLLVIGVLILAICILFVRINVEITIPLAMIMLGIGCSGYFILPPLMTGEIFGKKEYNKIWANVMVVANIVGAIAVPLYGVSYDITGAYNVAFVAVIIIAIIVGISGVVAVSVEENK